jgi:hypothetical protein
MDKPIAWYDPTNGAVSTDKDSPLFTPLGQVLPLYPQSEQEPVGEIVDAIEGAFKCSFTKMLPVGTKLYTTPPQRTWVGLTLEEILETYRGPDGSDYVDYARGIEAKLKEKNT